MKKVPISHYEGVHLDAFPARCHRPLCDLHSKQGFIFFCPRLLRFQLTMSILTKVLSFCRELLRFELIMFILNKEIRQKGTALLCCSRTNRLNSTAPRWPTKNQIWLLSVMSQSILADIILPS